MQIKEFKKKIFKGGEIWLEEGVTDRRHIYTRPRIE